MNRCIHERQRDHAHIALMCCGHIPMQPDFMLFNIFFEDDNVYFVDLVDEGPGPAARVFIGSLPHAYWPALSWDDAEQRARKILRMEDAGRMRDAAASDRVGA